jgi:hypothetical protein
VGEVLNINKLKIEKQYRNFYKHGALDLRLDNVKRNDNVVAINTHMDNVIKLKSAK